jgi:cytochrome c biogenesis protein CcmG, thiol:disulfide interchange protein DsbE
MKIMLRKHLDKLLLALAILLLLYFRLPEIFKYSQFKGSPLSQRSIQIIVPEMRKIDFPLPDKNYVVIFWATWCAPCKLEMNRLSQSVKEGKIPSDQIIAISPFEPDPTILDYLEKNEYPFTFVSDSSLAKEFNIEITPTTLLLERGIIKSISSGVSVWGIWQAEKLF